MCIFAFSSDEIISEDNYFRRQLFNMKRLLFAIFCLLTALNMKADKAYPFPVEVVQQDGTTLTIVQHGDEYFHYVTTVDGVLLVQKGNGYYVASVDAYGNLSATNQLAHNADKRGVEERALVDRQNRELFQNQASETSAIRRAMQEPVQASNLEFPHMGSPKAIVILAEFTDTTFTIENPKRSFEQYFNSNQQLEDYGRGESSNVCSVGYYFKTISFGQYTPQFDVYGPVTLPQPLKKYGGSNDKGSDENMSLLLQHACAAMDDSLDFSQYDANNDGYVDLVMVVYAGYSQSMSGNSNECIWPKSGNVSGGSYDGKRVSRYGVNAELNGFPGCYSSAPFKRINGIGTLCHEFSHCLGLPDFYPTLSSVKGDNQGMEFWSLMDSGNYQANGCAPTAYTAWEREAMGWIEIPTLTADTLLEIKSIDFDGTAYRIPNDSDATGQEYFIIENIQQKGLNYRQRGHGLLVYHVNYNSTAFSLSSNSVNNVKGKPRMTIVPADGLLFAQYNIDGVNVKNSDFYNQLAGDPFPGTSNVTALNDTMQVVNFQVYNGKRLNKALTEIEETDGIVKLKYVNNFDIFTGICDLTAITFKDDRIYSIDGRYMGTNLNLLPKGLYICNGKKTIKN